MTDKHPITPPPELVQVWASESLSTQNLCNRSAQWGADQELVECAEFLLDLGLPVARKDLLRLRRPKPLSLKEKALARLESLEKLAESMGHDPNNTIRRALESLPDD